MGVNGFIKIIKLAPRCVIKRNFRDYRGAIVAMDASQTLYKFCKALTNTKHYKNKNGEIIAHLFACFFKSCSAARYAIRTYWVFDGPPPSIKKNTLRERKKLREIALNKLNNECICEDEKSKLEKKSFSLLPKLTKEAKYLLYLMGLPQIDAPEEAEAQCAALEKSNITNGVSTEDWDALFFGCNKIFKNFSNKGDGVIEIDRQILLNELKMTQRQLIDLAAILGNDYCNGIIGLKPTDAYEKFKRCDFNMEKFLKHIKKDGKYTIPINFTNQWKESSDYYLNAPVIQPDAASSIWTMPNYDELYKYLLEKGFDEKDIQPRINELKLMYSYYLKDKKMVTLTQIKRELQVRVFGDKYVAYILDYINQNPPLMIDTG
jgi:flap endonuclease-1